MRSDLLLQGGDAAAVGMGPDCGISSGLGAGPLLDLACKIFCTDSAAVTLMDQTALYVLDGRGIVAGGTRMVDAWGSGTFCCWSTVSSMPSVLTVEDALLDARQGPRSLTGTCLGITNSMGLTDSSVYI